VGTADAGPTFASVRDRIPQQYVVGAVFVAAMFVSVLDTTIIFVALPSLGDQFDGGTSSIDWVVVGYLLSLAALIPASGWLGDRFGTKRTFLVALAIFTAASALCGFAQSLTQLIVFRVLQGAGGGMLTPIGTAMLFRAFPPAERARAARILMIPTVLAPTLGPILGGILVDQLSWRWIFFVNVPIGIAAFAFGALFLHEHREPRAGGFDRAGFVLAGGGLALVLYALGEGPTKGWGSATVIAASVVGLGAFVALVPIELGKAEPMLQFRILEDRLFRATNLTAFFAYAAFLGTLFVTQLFLQEARGLSASASGLIVGPEALGVLVSSQIVGRFYPHVGPRRLMTGGLVWVSCVIATLSTVDLDTEVWKIRVLMIALGSGMAFVIMPVQAAAFATISAADTGRASSLFSTQRQVAAAMGVAILATALSVLLPRDPTAREHAAAFHGVYRVAALLAFAGAIASLAIHDEDAAGTMRPRAAGPEPVLALE
jgi:EmrB/QacA subfamily drug resistance transporter